MTGERGEGVKVKGANQEAKAFTKVVRASLHISDGQARGIPCKVILDTGR